MPQDVVVGLMLCMTFSHYPVLCFGLMLCVTFSHYPELCFGLFPRRYHWVDAMYDFQSLPGAMLWVVPKALSLG
ncbi:MAG: hypothetical protein WCL70_13270 [Paludibacter sp.]